MQRCQSTHDAHRAAKRCGHPVLHVAHAARSGRALHDHGALLAGVRRGPELALRGARGDGGQVRVEHAHVGARDAPVALRARGVHEQQLAAGPVAAGAPVCKPRHMSRTSPHTDTYVCPRSPHANAARQPAHVGHDSQNAAQKGSLRRGAAAAARAPRQIRWPRPAARRPAAWHGAGPRGAALARAAPEGRAAGRGRTVQHARAAPLQERLRARAAG